VTKLRISTPSLRHCQDAELPVLSYITETLGMVGVEGYPRRWSEYIMMDTPSHCVTCLPVYNDFTNILLASCAYRLNCQIILENCIPCWHINTTSVICLDCPHKSNQQMAVLSLNYYKGPTRYR